MPPGPARGGARYGRPTRARCHVIPDQSRPSAFAGYRYGVFPATPTHPFRVHAGGPSPKRLWHVEICELPEETLNPGPIITRDQALQLDDPFADKRKFGPNGQYAKCEHCRAVFESLGFRRCSACSKSSSGVRVRCCEECGASLPPTGRKSLRFCSDACRQKAQRRDHVTDFVTLTPGGVPSRIRKKSAYWSRYWVISHVAWRDVGDVRCAVGMS